MIGKSKKRKLLHKIFAVVLAVIMAVPNMSMGQVAAEGESTNKIDVWDFGAEQLDTNVYNNMLTVDEINSWYPGVEAGTSGKNLASFTSTDGQLSFNDGGKSTTHRLRTTNESLTRYDAKSLKDANGVEHTGYVYSNSSSTSAVYVGINVTAGDKVTLAVGSNGGTSLINFEAPSGAVVTQEFTNSAKIENLTFYPTETGTYKIYSTTEKLVLARIYRQSTAVVAVTGTVTAPAGLSDYSVVFTNKSNGMQVTAPVTDGVYSANLNATYTYDVSLGNANGYIITSAKELAVTDAATFDVTVESVAQVTITGNITGLSEEALADLDLTFATDAIYKPVVNVSGTTYSVEVEVGASYTVVAEGINDYTLTSAETVSYTEAGTADITFAAKPTYAITIAPEGATTGDLANATFTFTNLNEEGYVYTFTGTEGIVLRDGTYSVKVTNSGIFVQELTSNLTVNGAAATKTIVFNSDVSSWDFRTDDYAGQASYNGLTLAPADGFNKHGSQYGLQIKNATIEVPVKGACEVVVSVGYNWDISFDDGTVSYFDNTNSGDRDVTYTYAGGAGTVTINAGSQCTSYIKKIEIVETSVYKDTITVGATGCDYTTINDALDAVAAMPRPNGERVTIEIQPGNYEEMLVINVPNVTLKNASSSPSIELKNKGVDIDANAVRITHYYGHGYTYYSMGADCKYDENILAVNKANGYESFVNPGTGTTSGSYWNATVVVGADGFEAEGIIFENSFNQYVSAKAANDVIVAQNGAKEPASAPRASLPAGSTAVQDKAYVERAAALAIKDNCKKVSFDNCKFIGRQDTLYGGKGATVAFYDCAVLGGTDYIFGGMTAVFAKCDLVFNTSENGNDVGYITAPQQASGRGYLMYNCKVTSTTPGVDTASEYTSKPGYLGRPWQAGTGEAVFYKTVVDAVDAHWYETSPSMILPAGWLNTLSGESALCGEYGTYEMAKDVDNTASRAAWSTVFAEEKLADGTPMTVAAFLGDWDAFAGKDMTIVMPTDKVNNAPAPEGPSGSGDASEVVYVLDTTTDLTAFSAGAKADGDMEKAGTEDYFTVIYSTKTKVDASNKTFEDAYASSQRLNFGGKTDLTIPKNAVKFTTSNPATVKVWWVEGGDDNRQIAIFDKDGNAVVQSTGDHTKNSAYIDTFELEEAGVYYVANPTNNNNFCKIEVTELVPLESATPITNILDATNDLEAVAQGSKGDGDTQKAGTNDFFTVIYSTKTKIDGSNKTFEDGYVASQRINFGAKTTVANGAVTANAVLFETLSPATVKVWWVSGGDGREVDIFNTTGITVVETAVGSVKNSLYISELTLEEAGKYYLGSADGSNYIFKIEVTETPIAVSEPEEFVLDATADLSAMAAGAKGDGDTEKAGTDDFFTVIYSAKTKIDSSNKTFEDGYVASQRINFGAKTTVANGAVTANAVQFKTENAAAVKVWWVSGGDGREMAIYDSAGNVVAKTAEGSVKNSLYISELALDESGTYYLGVPDGSNYVFKIQVIVEGSGGAVRPERAEWASVAAPVITATAQAGGDVTVTVSANVGYDGADEVVVTMYDANGAEVASKRSIAEKAEHVLTFAPAASGTYTFKAVMNRENETAKEAAEVGTFSYVLPLAKPAVTSVTCLGGGKATVAWTAVDEAEKYIVTVDGTTISEEATGTSVTLEGLTIGETYTFKVVAVRGTENSEAGSMSWKIVDSEQRTWSFAAFGSSTNTSNNKATGSVYDGNLKVESTNGKGKLVPASTDGLAFYYTTIDPETENFTLSADITVDEWTFSNGQEGFGMMAADAVGTHGDASTFWNNSYMATVTKVEYLWNSDTNSPSDIGTKYSMYMGVGAQEKIGATPENIAGGNPTANGFTSTMWPLDLVPVKKELDGGSYNIVANVTNTSALAAKATDLTPLQETFHLEIQRNNTGYFLTYTDAAGNSRTQKFYHGDNGDALTQIDPDNIYVGFYASRNAVISVDNVSLTTIHPDNDAPKEERPITYVTPNYVVESSSIANSADYELVFYANADGTLTITGDNSTILSDAPVTAKTKVRTNVALDAGVNSFKLTFTPDPNYVPGEYSEMANYDKKEINIKVTYKTNNGEVIYISPTGKANAAGTKEAPMDIYTAVKYAAPGQKLYLMEGTYNLTKTVTVERGINGNESYYIYLMADPEAAARPVLDFGGACAGMVLAGDYWYFQGFDVTKSAAGQKGLQVSGDYNVIDDVDTYRNGNTGIQISRYLGTDTYEDWPSNNLVLNCTSYLNADPGYEDADGFAAKLTVADGNVFDGCIAAYNADDGWDLFAKIESGPIGAVTIKNSLAFKNGYDIDANGNEINAGNGNGFKMGGSSITGYHVLENSIAFANKAKGIDSNSCPDIQVINSTSFNNGSYNVAFYTNDAANTDFSAEGIVSYKDANAGNTEGENIKPKGTQDQNKIYGDSNYYYPDGNKSGVKVTDAWFVNLDTDTAIHGGITRNADGTINMNGYLELTEAAGDAGAELENAGTASGEVDTRTAEEVIEDALAEVEAATTAAEVEAALEDVLALPESAWDDSSVITSLKTLAEKVSEKLQTTVEMENNSTIEVLDATSAILSVQAGKDAKVIMSSATAPTNVPESYANKELENVTAFEFSLAEEDGTPVDVKAPIVLKIKKPSNLSSTRTAYIFYYAADGSIEVFETTVKDGALEVAVNGAGTYVITNFKAASDSDDDDDDSDVPQPEEGNTSTGTSTSGSTTSTGTTTESGTKPSTSTEETTATEAPKAEEDKPQTETEKVDTPQADSEQKVEESTENTEAPSEVPADTLPAATSNKTGWLLVGAGVAAILFVVFLLMYKKQGK